MKWATLITITIIMGTFFWVAGGSDFVDIVQVKFNKTIGKTLTIEINNSKIEAEIADNAEERARGLSNREGLNQDSGMIFVHPAAGIYEYWMKDVKFPLDFIWISGNKVADLTKNVKIEPGPSYTRYKSSVPIDFVLEVNAGFIDRHVITVGQEVKFSKVLK